MSSILVVVVTATSAATAVVSVKQLDVAVLHVVAVLAHGLLCVGIAPKGHVGVAGGLALAVILYVDVDGVYDGAEPL